jgi:DNA-binding transcriptional LysR family regulator
MGAGHRWLGVEFRHFGALGAVARTGSFRRAAESLGYVQSAISGQIAQLERAVGTQLVERSSGSSGATLTPAGRVLLGHVEEILARFEAARVDVHRLAEGAESVVRLTVIDGVGSRRLPDVLRSYSGVFPEADVIIDENPSEEQSFERLAKGELDLMITELPVPPGPFEHTLLERDPYVLLVASDSLVAEAALLPTASELNRFSLVLPSPVREADTLRAKLDEAGIQQQPWLQPHSTAAVQAMVSARLGVGIVPALAVDPDDQGTVSISLPGLLPERLIALVQHREREYSQTVLGFVDAIKRVFSSRAP